MNDINDYTFKWHRNRYIIRLHKKIESQKHVALSRKSKDWLTRNYNIVPEWGESVSRRRVRIMVMVFSTTFNNKFVILWLRIVLVEETGLSGENNRTPVCYWQTLSHKGASNTPVQIGWCLAPSLAIIQLYRGVHIYSKECQPMKNQTNTL
jgi:hypothetical protein